MINKFSEQYKAIIIFKDENDPEVTKTPNNLSVIKWAGNFEDIIYHAIAVQMIPRAYVTKEYNIEK